MKALLVGVLVWVALAAPAQAHSITMAGAKRTAERFVVSVGNATVPPARARVIRCVRRTRHTVDCSSRFVFRSGVACERTVRVSMATRSRRVSRRFLNDLRCNG